MLCLCRDHAGEQQHSDQVRDGHECIQHVRNSPHKVERKHGGAHNDRDKQHLIRQNCLLAEQILSGTLAVVRPSEDGGVRERNDADHQNQRTDIRNLCECRRGHLTAVCHVFHADRRIFHHRGNEHQTGHQAHDNRRPEGAGRRNERLPHRIARLRRAGNQRRRAHAGLIREQAACHAVLQRQTDTAADQSAGHRARLERQHENGLESRQQKIVVGAQNNDAADHIEQRHQRHQFFAHNCNGFNAANNDNRGDNAENNADCDTRQADGEVGLQHLGNRVDLRAAADAERGEHGEQRKQHRHHLAELLPLEAALKRVHRAAHHAAVRGLHAVLDRDQALRVLSGNAEHAGQPAPQHGTRSAEIDGRADTDDVARADGRRECGRQRLKLTDVTRRIRVLCHRQADAG